MTAVPRRRQWQPRASANGLLGLVAASRHTTLQSTRLGRHPVTHVPNYMDHYSFTDHWGWMAELAMLADQQLNHKVVTHPASSLAQDRESSTPAETSVLTTMLRCQLTVLVYYKD